MSQTEPSTPKAQTQGSSFWRNHRYTVFGPLVFLAFFLGLRLLEVEQYLDIEYRTRKLRYEVRAGSDEPAHKDILLIGIDDNSIATVGHWPWRRDVHAAFLQLLQLLPPSVITFDIFFSEVTDKKREETFQTIRQLFNENFKSVSKEPDAELERILAVFETALPDYDAFFAEAASLHPNVITGALTQAPPEGNDKEIAPDENPPWEIEGSRDMPLTRIVGDATQVFGNSTALYPIEALQKNSHFAFVDTEASVIDGIRRRYPVVVRTAEKIYPSLALKSVMLHWGLTAEDVEVRLGDAVILHRESGETRIPINEKGEMWINYRSKDGFKLIGFSLLMGELLAMYQQDTDYPEQFPNPEGKILVIGQTAAGLTDFGPTPFEGRTPLVRVQANVMDNILKGDFLTIPSPLPIAVGCLALMWITLFTLKDRPHIASVGIPLIILITYIGFAFWIFMRKSVLLPMVWPTFSFLGVHLGAFYLSWKKDADQKNRIKGMFGTYLSPELVSKMVNSGEEPKLGGEDVTISAFFSDVQSFSSFSEKLTPQQLVDLMNEYLTAMTNVLMERGCYVDKYIGDAIVGIFNAPIELEGHALQGCIACIEQHKRLEELRQKWRSEGDKWPKIVHNMQARMGMNTGRATVGNMGSENRFNYTMMGDTVNLAARCESGAKAYGVYTMVTGETKTAAEAAGDDCIFRFLDKIIVKGRSVPAEMYEVVCLRADLDEETALCLKTYEEALKLYLAMDWDRAHEKFIEASQLEPNRKEKNSMAPTTPSLVMAERSLAMKANPPSVPEGEVWDGVYVMTSK